MGSFFESRPASFRGIGTKLEGRTVTASIESGIPLRLASWLTLEPMAQFIWQRNWFDDAADPFSRMSYTLADTMFGRLGLRLEGDVHRPAGRLQPYVQVNLWHGFPGTDITHFNDVIALPTPFSSTIIEVGGGIVARLNSGFSLYAHGDYSTNITGNFREALRGQIGMRVVW
jgi:outer membrane autotransporter protein